MRRDIQHRMYPVRLGRAHGVDDIALGIVDGLGGSQPAQVLLFPSPMLWATNSLQTWPISISPLVLTHCCAEDP